ncbi:NADH dehydrogenase I chain M domain protein [Orientia tsutsugamushi str. Sido]|nr:NADH dehydrogenase I chain M domain protein [Orientia tsutsugamushi str. Sido]
MLGEITNQRVYQLNDISLSEKLAVLPLIVAMFIIGVYPKFILNILLIPAKNLSNLFII